jgi:hypothetical protein
MSTNYYAVRSSNQCEHTDLLLHIGKSSFGWCFALATHPERGINDLADWENLLADPSWKIEDEYDRPVTVAELISVITERSGPGECSDGHLRTGPNGLWRPPIDGTHCIGHGAGTWDLFAGEFS